MTPQAYASMTVTRDARDTLQRLALTHSARLGRRLSMSTVLLAALATAEAHPDDLIAQLAHANGDTT
jgi:hypothetical protein